MERDNFVEEVFRRIKEAPEDRTISVGLKNGTSKSTHTDRLPMMFPVFPRLIRLGVDKDKRVLVLMKPGFDFFSSLSRFLASGPYLC